MLIQTSRPMPAPRETPRPALSIASAHPRPAAAQSPTRPAPKPPGVLDGEARQIAQRFHQACGNWSNRALAPLLGVSYETVRRYRTGQTALPAHVAARFCFMFQVSAEWLLLSDAAAEHGEE